MNPEQDNRRSGPTASTSSTNPAGGSRPSGQADPGQASAMGRMVGETVSSLGETAKQAGAQAQDAASSLGSRANEQARRLADRQLTMGAEMIGDVAEAVRSAAERLERNEPQIAYFARGAADRIEDLSETVRDQSAEELWHATAEFARRRPAVLFGATAGLGFLLFRLLKPGSGRGYGAGTMRANPDWGRAGGDRPGGPGGSSGGSEPAMRARQPGGGPLHGA